MSEDGPEESKATVERHFFRNKKFLIALIIVVLIVVVGLIITLRHNHSKDKAVAVVHNACTSKAAGNILEQSHNGLFGTDQLSALQSVKKILKLQDYQRDPNCLYVVVVYYINSGNATYAEKYYNEFKMVYKPQDYLSSKLGVDIPNPNLFQSQINNLKAGH